ncbi:MAG: phosphatase PAP2 family protein [Bdellovibrionales bacterium]|nr:phosphatase PAP2 family protein [Bdellovibrionales bacterium]
MSFLFLTSCQTTSKKDSSLNFTDTQKWGEEEDHFRKNWKPVFVDLTPEALNLKIDPPREHSQAFQREKTYLLALQGMRSEHDLKEIEIQKHVCGFYFDGFRLGFNRNLDNFLMDAYMDSRLLGFRAKAFYNRIRPSFSVPGLTPSIENPGHPAYPSNHSIQATLMALILGEIVPNNKATYLNSARRIARNRELAGVHYPSDSEYGMSLAFAVFERLVKNKTFQERLSEFKGKKFKMVTRKIKTEKKDSNACLNYTKSYAIKNGVW